MENNQIRLYNLIFPMWFMLWFPGWYWLIILPVNFLVDYLVLKVCFKKKVMDNYKSLLKKYSWKTWIYGFLADLIGAIYLLIIYGGVSIVGEGLIDAGSRKIGIKISVWANDSMISAWDNPLGFIVSLSGVALAGFLVYKFNFSMLKKNEAIGEDIARYVAKWLAIITAPYLIMIPIYFY